MKKRLLISLLLAVLIFLAWPYYYIQKTYYSPECTGVCTQVVSEVSSTMKPRGFGGGIRYIQAAVNANYKIQMHDLHKQFYGVGKQWKDTSYYYDEFYFPPFIALGSATGTGILAYLVAKLAKRFKKSRSQKY